MRIKPVANTEWTDEGFVDHLDRHAEIENLTRILLNIEHPIVIGLNSAWGTGKTTFIHMWKQRLSSEDVTSVYFNAWTAELLADPLIALTTEIAQRISEEGGLSKEGIRNLELLTNVAGKIVSRGLPTLLKKVSGDAIDLDEETQDAIGEVIGRSAEEIIKDYKSGKSDCSKIGELLSKVITKRKKTGPVVVFVDELDRCRPSHAITVLERIKHVFELQGLQFIVSLDGQQLAHSIRAVYGEGFDADIYLRRFFDLEYTLEVPSLKGFIDALWQVYGLPSEEGTLYDEWTESNCARELLAVLGPLLGASVRDLEQVLGQLRIAHELTRDFVPPTMLLQALLLLLGAQQRSVFNNVVYAADPSQELRIAIDKIFSKTGEVSCANAAVAAAIALSGQVEEIMRQASAFEEQATKSTPSNSASQSPHLLSGLTSRFAQSIGRPGARFDPDSILSSIRFATRTR